MAKREGPDILVFPPAVSVAVPLAAVALQFLVPFRVLPAIGTAVILVPGLALIALAGWLAISGERAFRRAGTNVDPRKPSLVLVSDGPFRFTRNPMYLGMVILQLGLALTFSLDWALVGAVTVLGILHFGVVLREEAYLTETYGGPYRDYLKQTRRWV